MRALHSDPVGCDVHHLRDYARRARRYRSACPGRVQGDNHFTDAELIAMRAKLGLDQPMIVQYVDWLKQLMALDFGQSLYGASPLGPEVMRRWLNVTLEITVLPWCSRSRSRSPVESFRPS